MRAEDGQGTPTQKEISPSVLVYEDKVRFSRFYAEEFLRPQRPPQRSSGQQPSLSLIIIKSDDHACMLTHSGVEDGEGS